MKKIQNMLKIKPDLDKLNLSFLQIESLDDIAYELYHFENLKEVDLSCNRIKKLPPDLSILKNITRLDVSNNLFDNIINVLGALATMPNLVELNLTYEPTKIPHHISYYLPFLEVINGDVIRAGGIPVMNNHVVKVGDGRFEVQQQKSSAELLTHGFLLYEDELINFRHFHQHVYTIIQDGGNNNPKNQSKAFLDAVKAIEEGVKSAYKFNDNMIEKAQEGVYVKNFETFEVKREFIYTLVKNYCVFIRERYPKIASASDNLFNLTALLLTNLEKQAAYLEDDIIEKEKSHENGKNGLDVSPLNRKEDMDTEKVLLKLKLTEAQNELDELKRENDEMYKFLINSNKKDVLEYAKKVNKNTYANPNETKKFSETGANKSNNLLQLKSYTLRQMIDLINDIMDGKKGYEEKSAKTKAQPETLESYLFIYFSKKYGLKDLVLVEVSSIVEMIKGFASKSIEIETFKRILKNEIDEKFYWMLQNIKADFKLKLEQYYREKVKKSAGVAEVLAWAGTKMNGNLEKEEAEFILNLSYKGAELKSLLKAFKVFFDENDVNVKDKNVLPYSLLLEFVFGYELEKHAEYLKNVSDYFNSADDDKNGVLNKKQLLEFLDVLAKRNAQVNLETLIQQSDPHGHNRVTFSKLIEVLSSNFEDREKQKNLVQFLNKI